jgi:hypothetical protein
MSEAARSKLKSLLYEATVKILLEDMNLHYVAT